MRAWRRNAVSRERLAAALYIVIAGCLAVTVRSSNGRNMMVARIRAGDIVGKLGRMSDRSMIEQ